MNQAPQHSFPWRITAIVAVVVVVASVIVGLLLARDRVDTAPPVATAQPSALPSHLPLEPQRQVTLLLTVRDADRVAVSSVLVGVGGDTGFVAELMLPRDLLLPTAPPIRLEQATDPTGAQLADEPLETLLGVQVDAVLDLDRLAWAALIDGIGAPVDPAMAERPTSFALVLDRVLQALPADAGTVGVVMTGLGSMARITVTNEDGSALLALVGADARELEVRRERLPVAYLRSGADRVAVADQSATAEAVAQLFPGALLQPGHGGQLRAVVQRAGAPLGAVLGARLALQDAGFGVLQDRSPAAAVTDSLVYVPDGSPAALAAGRDAALALGLPESVVRVDGSESATVDVRVVLGSDRPPV